MVDPSTISNISTQRFNKIIPIPLITLQNVTSSTRVVISSELPVTNVTSASIMIHMGRTVTTAFTAGINFRIEASSQSSGDGHWYPITIFTSALGSSVATEAVSAAAVAGQNVIPMADTTGFVAGDIIFIQNTTIGNSEFARVALVTAATSITIEDNLVNTQTTSTVFDQAELYYAQIDCSSIIRLRLVVDGSGTGQNFAVSADAIVGS